MKFYQPAFAKPRRLVAYVFAAAAFFGVAIGEAQAQSLPEASPCELALEGEASQRIFDLKLQLGRTNALSTDEFASIQASLKALLGVGDSAKATSCFNGFVVQKQRYERWFRQQASAIVKEAHRRLDRSCSRHTDMYIRTHRNRIDSAVRRKKLAKAAKLATEMREGIVGAPMIRDCPSMQKRLGVLLSYYIPDIQNQAALPHVLARLARAHDSAHETLGKAHESLGTRGRSMKLAPSSLEAPEGQTRIRDLLTRCTQAGKTLSDIEAPSDSKLPGRDDLARTAVAYCAQELRKLDATVAQVAAHNASYRTAELARWKRTQLKSWPMEKLFNAHGRPLAESTSPAGLIIWTYRSSEGDCVQHRFSKVGKPMGERTQSCPVLSAK